MSSVVRIELPDGTTERFAVHGGFMQVATGVGSAAGLLDPATDGDRTTRVTLLAGIAEHVQSIDVTRAEAAREVAQARLAATAGRDDDEDDRLGREQAEASLVRATLRLQAAAEAAPAGSAPSTATALISWSLSRRCIASTLRTVPERERITRLWVCAPWSW